MIKVVSSSLWQYFNTQFFFSSRSNDILRLLLVVVAVAQLIVASTRGVGIILLSDIQHTAFYYTFEILILTVYKLLCVCWWIDKIFPILIICACFLSLRCDRNEMRWDAIAIWSDDECRFMASNLSPCRGVNWIHKVFDLAGRPSVRRHLSFDLLKI